MSENTKIWDILGRTDPAHTRAFSRSGGFKGTAIKPIWSFRRMTEEFGPCGVGWGVGEPVFQVVPAGEEILVYCTAKVWFKHDDNHSQHIYGVGGDKVVGKNKYGLNTDDEAFKKAFTDAVTNALKLIGVGADVHMGLFEDNKYVREMTDEFSDAPPPKSSAALKREGGWEEFRRELAECDTTIKLDRFREAWRKKAIADGWNATFKATARDEIEAQEERIKQADEFPGDLPATAPRGEEAHNSYVNAFRAG
ncbi:MAG: hypothetical protein M9939_00910 [Mesorhizobium sp.]|nr:hypothetical protein [Mesorhizobium sp.]MCO5159668.1 hypothetical protein [Mesorhizobium sp.]